ncbi:MAG: DUF4143 domain-containing protein [Clostridia bacterium]|nr:DUF4143 domain-containing protein [Clostridia bacterium]
MDFSSECLTKRLTQAKPFDADDVFDYIWRGGMPYIQSADTETLSAYMSSYVSTYLLNDTRNESGRINEATLFLFLKACAESSGYVLNLNDIAKKTGVSYPSAKRWLGILIKLNILYLLHPYHNNKLKRLIKTPNLYFTDTGLCANLAGWLTKETLQKGCEAGHYLENFVVSALMRDISYSSQNYALTYYRDTNGKEVDLFLEADGKIFPLEIKLSASPTRREVKKYAVLDDNGIARGMGGINCMNPSVIPIDEYDNNYPGERSMKISAEQKKHKDFLPLCFLCLIRCRCYCSRDFSFCHAREIFSHAAVMFPYRRLWRADNTSTTLHKQGFQSSRICHANGVSSSADTFLTSFPPSHSTRIASASLS